MNMHTWSALVIAKGAHARVPLRQDGVRAKVSASAERAHRVCVRCIYSGERVASGGNANHAAKVAPQLIWSNSSCVPHCELQDTGTTEATSCDAAVHGPCARKQKVNALVSCSFAMQVALEQL
jgi:hypothetical protein